MKFKTTLILMIVFAVLLAFIFLTDIREKGKPGPADKLIDLSSDDVEKIILKNGEETIAFSRNEEGDWLITEPLEAKADKNEVERIADDFSSLDIDRIVEEEPADLEKYGIPQKEISLFFKGKEEPIKILVGMENPLDKKFFTKRKDKARVVLIGSAHKSLLEKNIFDFREKKIFRFETDEVKKIVLRSENIRWEAAKEEEDWFLKKPVESLAEQNQIESFLSSLSDLTAKEFISEAKTDEDTKEYTLDNPDHAVTLELPLQNQKVTYSINKKDDKVYATSSLSSKIVEVEDSIIEKLKKKPGELREKEVADFYTWETIKVQIEKDGMMVNFVKDKDNNWHFDNEDGEEADKEKIESLVRNIENLEAEEFIDPPFNIEDYGLDNPQAKITVSVEEDEEKAKDITILIGKTFKEKVDRAEEEQKEISKPEEEVEGEEKGEEKDLVIVKNARFDYLFKTDASFLKEIPQKIDGWKKTEPEAKDDKN